MARALSLCTPLMLAGLVVLLLWTVGEVAARRQTASAGSPACGIAAGASVFTKQMQQPVTDGVVRLVGVANSDMADLTPFFRAVAIQGSNRGGVIRLKSDCDAAANPAQRALVEAVAVGTHAPDATGEQGTVAGLTGLLAQIRAGSLVSLWSQDSTNQSCATQGAAVPAKNDKCPRSSTSSALTLSPVRVVMFMALFFSLLAVAGAADARQVGWCLAITLLAIASVEAQTTGSQTLPATTGATTGMPVAATQDCSFGIEIAFECNDGCGCPGRDSLLEFFVSDRSFQTPTSVPVQLVGQAATSCDICTPSSPVGRPFISHEDAPASLAASVEGPSDWCTLITNSTKSPPATTNFTKSATTNVARGRKWLETALGEHASVASFNVFSLQLLGLGAPSDLVAAAQRAGLDEVAHAEASFAVAGRLLGHEVGPGPLSAVGKVQIATDAARVAQLTAREGCVHEMASTLEAALKLDRDHDRRPSVDAMLEADERRVLQMVVRDEARHAGLAWRATAWLSTRFGAEVANSVRGSVEQEMPAALAHLRRSGASEEQLKQADLVWSRLAKGDFPKTEEPQSPAKSPTLFAWALDAIARSAAASRDRF